METLWFIAVVTCLIYGPAGLVFTVALLAYEYIKPEKAGQHILFYGLAELLLSVFMIAAILFILGLMEDDQPMMMVFPLMWTSGVIGGALSVAVYTLLNRKKYLLDACENLINGEHITSLMTISDILGIEYRKVKKAVGLLIKKGRFGEASIDDRTKEIIFKKSIWAKQRVVCERCGAELIVDFGATLICEYCSSALKVKRIDPDLERKERQKFEERKKQLEEAERRRRQQISIPLPEKELKAFGDKKEDAPDETAAPAVGDAGPVMLTEGFVSDTAEEREMEPDDPVCRLGVRFLSFGGKSGGDAPGEN